jgi:hypothetical protein
MSVIDSNLSYDIHVSFWNDYQKAFFENKQRNGCFSGGFGNGKTYGGCQRAVVPLLTFNRYRYAIVRKAYSDLKRTTMQSFSKLIPGGFSGRLVERHSEQEGLTDFINGSRIYWLHSDKFDEGTLKGLEINSVLIDQAEELEENIYLVLDARVGRWDGAEVPAYLLDKHPDWPRHNKTNRPLVPNYMDILVNPDHTLHWVYQRYHPESINRQPDHFFINAPTDPNSYDPQTYAQMLKRDPEWVAKYVKGEWGTSEAQIHNVLPDSILKDVPPDFLKEIIKKGSLTRVLDHGDASPTCCTWFSTYKGIHIAYREYYMPHEVISNHRQNISDLSYNEFYTGNYADPSIFHMESQKAGGFWSVADEYLDTVDISSPPLFWNPADNNEFANRNRINELLRSDPTVKHPLYGTSPAPRLYFLAKTPDYQNGCFHIINQTKSQRRESLGTINGKLYFSDERAKSVEDHAYDTLRYYVSTHAVGVKEPKRPYAANSFNGLRNSIKKMQQAARVMWN